MAFHSYADQYDLHASVQIRVVERLLSLVNSHLAVSPAVILDIGCGTGQLLSRLNRHYPGARLYGLDLAFNMTCRAQELLGSNAVCLNGDAEHLPFKINVFDLVVSTSTLQWLENLDACFKQCQRVLKDDGLLCCAFFGGKTLWELHECMNEAVCSRLGGKASKDFLDRLHRFKDISAVQNVLERMDFSSVLVSSEIEMDYFQNVPELLQSIKRIGAGSSAQESQRGGLGWRGVLNETSRLYQKYYGVDGRIPVTYEVFYIVACNNGNPNSSSK